LAGPKRIDAHDLLVGDAEERVDLVDQQRDAEIAAAHEEPAARPRRPLVAEQGREIVGREEPAADAREAEQPWQARWHLDDLAARLDAREIIHLDDEPALTRADREHLPPLLSARRRGLREGRVESAPDLGEPVEDRIKPRHFLAPYARSSA